MRLNYRIRFIEVEGCTVDCTTEIEGYMVDSTTEVEGCTVNKDVATQEAQGGKPIQFRWCTLCAATWPSAVLLSPFPAHPPATFV